MPNVKSQMSNIGKGAVKQILQEPVEIVKDVGEQITGSESLPSQAQQQSMAQTGTPTQPSLEEQKKERILAAHRRELEEEITRKRQERTEQEQARAMEEKKTGEEKRQVEEAKKESLFQKGLKLVTGRLKRRMETRIPKAA